MSSATLRKAAAVLLLLVCLTGITAQNFSGVGSKTCDECSPNANCLYRGLDENEEQLFECVCKTDYKGTGEYCKAISPCDAGTDNCDSNAECVKGTADFEFTCKCPDGFESNDRGITCKDKNECEDEDICANSKCVNLQGTYECTCDVGYKHPIDATTSTEDVKTCDDIDECGTDANRCGNFSKCKNFPGGFKCECSIGAYPAPNGLYCIDDDECLRTPSPCNTTTSVCKNTDLSYRCDCLTGYEHPDDTDNVTCIDVDECTTGIHNCPSNSTCNNTIGSFVCDCDEGLKLSSDGSSCDDVDECTLNTPCNLERSTCNNVAGGYKCDCKDGYRKNTTNSDGCDDVDECTEKTHKCDYFSFCSNTIGGYNCTCYYGYKKDVNGTCVEVSPSFSELEEEVANLSNTQVLLDLEAAYNEKRHLKNRLERLKRRCTLKEYGVTRTPPPRFRRDATAAAAGENKRLTLQKVKHENSNLSLEIAVLEESCGLK